MHSLNADPEYALNVLLVEDDEDARASLQDVLELDGHRVAAFAGAKAALESDELVNAHVVILDRKLPDGMAEDLLGDFRQCSPQSHVIIVTGYADLEGTIAAMRGGASDYIIKPINAEELLRRLQRIADHLRTESALVAERNFAELVLSTAEAVVLVLDTSGRVVRGNEYLADLCGYSLDELHGEDWFERCIPERDRDRIREVFDRTVQEIETRGIVNPIQTKLGDERQVRWSNTTLRDKRNRVNGVLCIGLDVTDLVHAQEELVRSERLAAIGQTMTGLAHESRNALQRIQNALELLQDDLADNDEALRDLVKIERASHDLRNLLEEVRSYAAPIHLDLSVTQLSHVWRRAWANLSTRVGDRHAQLDERIDQDSNDLSLQVDTRRMEQVFRNLFENALDACGEEPKIAITQRASADEIHVEVQDNGPGLPAATTGKVFDAFFTTKATGTGLGLAIVDRIIAAHGGTIEVESSGTGTTFIIGLPRNSPSRIPS